MVIFTPNTVIRSTEVNSNFDEVTGRLDLLEEPIYAYGTLGGELSGDKTFTQTAGNGITKTSATVYTIATAGLYQFYAQQLITTTGGATYFFSKVNGSTIHHGWHYNIQKDITTTFTRLLNAGDYITCNYDSYVTSCWGGSHSVYYLNLLKRT